MRVYWGGIVAGGLFIINGLIAVVSGEDSTYWGAPVYAWTGWIFLFAGIAICLLSIRALWRWSGKSPVYTDEDAQRAKEEMNKMYLREHGTLPDDKRPGKDN